MKLLCITAIIAELQVFKPHEFVTLTNGMQLCYKHPAFESDHTGPDEPSTLETTGKDMHLNDDDETRDCSLHDAIAEAAWPTGGIFHTEMRRCCEEGAHGISNR